MCDHQGWRLKKRLTMAPNAPRRKSRLVQTKCKRSSLQLEDDDPMMERAFATEGGCAPLSTSSDDEVKPVHTMARITPGVDEPIEQESVDNQPIEQESVDEQTEAVFEGDTPEEMGQPLDEE